MAKHWRKTTVRVLRDSSRAFSPDGRGVRRELDEVAAMARHRERLAARLAELPVVVAERIAWTALGR